MDGKNYRAWIVVAALLAPPLVWNWVESLNTIADRYGGKTAAQVDARKKAEYYRYFYAATKPGRVIANSIYDIFD